MSGARRELAGRHGELVSHVVLLSSQLRIVTLRLKKKWIFDDAKKREYMCVNAVFAPR